MKARVVNNRIVLDEPTDLPEGTELNLVVDDGGDELTSEERAVLDRAIETAWDSVKSGKVRPAAELLQSLRGRS